MAAVVAVFEIKKQHKEYRKKAIEDSKCESFEGVRFIKQEKDNACGSIALLHSVLNSTGFMMTAGFEENSFLDKFNIYLQTGEDITEQVKTQEIAQINEEMA